MLDAFIDTSRYVYNLTLEHINKGHKINFQELRDLLVTQNTKKNLDEYKAYDCDIKKLQKDKKKLRDAAKKNGKEVDAEQLKIIEDEIKAINKNRRNHMKDFDYSKNRLIKDFEANTPKDVRACAVKRCCDAYKTGFTNLRKGNIKHFKMAFKKKKDKIQSFEITPKIIAIKNGEIRIAPDFFKDECVLKTHKKLTSIQINNNVDIVRRYKEYYVHLCVETEVKEVKTLKTIAGVDLGIRTFATIHSHNEDITVIKEYKHRADLLKKLNTKLNLLKTLKRIRKKQFKKIEDSKINLVNRLHWDFISGILIDNDVIYLGDIKSHDIVKDGKNKTLNLAFNDLKFYQLKQRLIYKAYLHGKKVFLVPEHYTTKTCSCCGKINNNVGCKEVFECDHCKLVAGRDVNAAKNIKMKGIFSN